MAKLFSPNVGKNFGEAFISTVKENKKLRQQQQQFEQEMAFRNRQLNFLNAYREGLLSVDMGNLEARNREQDFRERPIEPKPITQSRLKPLGGGIVEEQFIAGDNGETIVGYESLISPDRTNRMGETPLYDLSGSANKYREYTEFQNTAERRKDPETQQISVDVAGETNLLSPIQFEGMKKSKFQAVIDATDNEARKITQKVPGFYGSFQEFMDARGKEIEFEDGTKMVFTKDNIDEVVNKAMKNQSSQTRDAMKTLLKRRIF